MEQTIRDTYLRHFGEYPQAIVRAPGRINLIGEHTDYNEGFVLPAAIDKAIWLALGRRADDVLNFHALDLGESYSGTVKPIEKSGKNWANYLLGVINELALDGHEIGGLNVVFGGDIPIGAGLSSSAALESGMLAGLDGLFGLQLQKHQMAKLAQRGENNFVGMKCGIMDMFASIFGKKGHVMRLDCRSLDFEYFPLQATGLSLLLCNSGVKHSLVESAYNARRAECEEGVRLLQATSPGIRNLRDVSLELLLHEKNRLPAVVFQRCKYVVEEIERVNLACNALRTNDFAGFGKLLFDCHEGLREGYEVTCPETDFLVEMASRHSSVLGARQMGGGFGGCTLNLLALSEAEAFSDEIRHKYTEKYGIVPSIYEVELTDGVSLL